MMAYGTSAPPGAESTSVPGTVRPVTDERDGLLAYIAQQTEAVKNYHHGIQHAKNAPAPDPVLEGLASYCQVLFSSNRFLYVE